jgi:hypothetical protein
MFQGSSYREGGLFPRVAPCEEQRLPRPCTSCGAHHVLVQWSRDQRLKVGLMVMKPYRFGGTQCLREQRCIQVKVCLMKLERTS